VKLHGQRKYLKEAEIGFLAKGTCVALQPDDVITINNANYGGEYDVLIDSMKINKDLSIQFQCSKYTSAFDDWADLTPTALTIPDDDTPYAWKPAISGPTTVKDIGRSAFDTWGKEYLTVGPQVNVGKETNLQKALNAVKQAGGGSIYIINGTYSDLNLTIPDVNLEIIGQSQGGVILKNLAGSDLFSLHNLTKTFSFKGFSIASQNVAVFSKMFVFYGDTDAENTASLTIKDVTIVLKDDAGVNGDYGLYISKGQTGSVSTDHLDIVDGRQQIYSPNKYNSLISIMNGKLSNSQFDCIDLYAASLKINANNISSVRSGYGIQAGACDRGLISQNEISGAMDIGILIDGTLNSQISENVINTTIASGSSTISGIDAVLPIGGSFSGNRVNITNAGTGITRGINFAGCTDSAMKGNIIVINEADTTNYHYGILLGVYIAAHSLRNVVEGNNIDMTNGDAKDIGIRANANSNNNRGTGNIITNAGTQISDDGTENTINKFSGGSF
jgi:hypothetical protein